MFFVRKDGASCGTLSRPPRVACKPEINATWRGLKMRLRNQEFAFNYGSSKYLFLLIILVFIFLLYLYLLNVCSFFLLSPRIPALLNITHTSLLAAISNCLLTNKLGVFRCVRIVAKSAYYICSCPRLQVNGFPLNLTLGTFMRICQLLRFQCNIGYANAPQHYVICTLPIFFLTRDCALHNERCRQLLCGQDVVRSTASSPLD